MSSKYWSNRVAGLAVDALTTAQIIKKEDFERAVDIVSEEIYVRLCLGDAPPPESGDDSQPASRGTR
jgi:hypothetical protein